MHIESIKPWLLFILTYALDASSVSPFIHGLYLLGCAPPPHVVFLKDIIFIVDISALAVCCKFWNEISLIMYVAGEG